MRRAALVAFAVSLVGLLSGCEDRECVRGHHQPVPVGKVTTLIWICDKYADGGS